MRYNRALVSTAVGLFRSLKRLSVISPFTGQRELCSIACASIEFDCFGDNELQALGASLGQVNQLNLTYILTTTILSEYYCYLLVNFVGT